MNNTLILLPLIAQILLVFIVWCLALHQRVGAVKQGKVRLGDLTSRARSSIALISVAGTSDNFSNLFEMPVLFYVAVLLIYSMGLTDAVYLILASVFVVSRYMHSVIHITYNNVLHRFWVYLGGSIIVMIIWLRLSFEIINQAFT